MHFLSSQAAIWTNIGILLLVIEVVVLIHEFGHFIVAKLNNVRVAEFSIGMGPSLFQWKRNGTTFSFRLFPIGGYVAVLSQHTLQEIEKIKLSNPTEEQKEFINKKLHGLTIDEDYSWQKPIEKIKWTRRGLFAAMGVIFNFISIILFTIIAYTSVGKPVSVNTPNIFIRSTSGNIGYRLESIDLINPSSYSNPPFKKISGFNELRNFLKNPEDILGKAGTSTYWATDKDFKDKEFVRTNVITKWNWKYNNNENIIYSHAFTPDHIYYSKENHITKVDYPVNCSFPPTTMCTAEEIEHEFKENTWKIPMPLKENPSLMDWGTPISGNSFGISYKYFNETMRLQKYSGIEAIGLAFKDSFTTFGQSWILIGDILSFGSISRNSDTTGQVLFHVNGAYWISIIMNMTILISALIIAFNLLPIPPLDGFKIFESFYIGLKGREIDPEKMATANRAGWTFIMMLTVLTIMTLL